jgi:hypothetical protein
VKLAVETIGRIIRTQETGHSVKKISEEQAVQIWEYDRQGYSYKTIAQKMGVAKDTVAESSEETSTPNSLSRTKPRNRKSYKACRETEKNGRFNPVPPGEYLIQTSRPCIARLDPR